MKKPDKTSEMEEGKQGHGGSDELSLDSDGCDVGGLSVLDVEESDTSLGKLNEAGPAESN